MNPEFHQLFSELETTVQSGNFSYEGLDFLINKCVAACNGQIEDLTVAIAIIIRNSTRAKDSCDRVHDLMTDRYGESIVNRVLKTSISKLELEVALLLSN